MLDLVITNSFVVSVGPVVGNNSWGSAIHRVALGTNSPARLSPDDGAFVQRVEIDRATIITSAEKGSPRMKFSAVFYQKIAISALRITLPSLESAKPAPRVAR